MNLNDPISSIAMKEENTPIVRSREVLDGAPKGTPESQPSLKKRRQTPQSQGLDVNSKVDDEANVSSPMLNNGHQRSCSTAGDEASIERPRRSFKAIGNLVLAMKRFQAALNPTYTYGKQSSASPIVHHDNPSPGVSIHSQGNSSQRHCFPDRGHKGSLLMQPLPDVGQSDEEEGVCQQSSLEREKKSK